MALKRLANELSTIQTDQNYNYMVNPDETNFLLWNFIIIGPVDTYYEGGIFKGQIHFTNKYPLEPPTVYFDKIIHPNVYKNGAVCISILHSGVDNYGYEQTTERWTPLHSVDSIMLSIILRSDTI